MIPARLLQDLGLPCLPDSFAVQRLVALLRRVQGAVRECDKYGFDITLERLLGRCLPEVGAFYALLRARFPDPLGALACVYFDPDAYREGTDERFQRYSLYIEDALTNGRTEVHDIHEFEYLYKPDGQKLRLSSATSGMVELLRSTRPSQMCIRHVEECLDIACSGHGLSWSQLPSTWTSDSTLMPRCVKPIEEPPTSRCCPTSLPYFGQRGRWRRCWRSW